MFSSLDPAPNGLKKTNVINESDSFVNLFMEVTTLNIPKKFMDGKSTGVGGSVAEVLLGEQQKSFAVHLERSAGDRPQGKLLLCPSQPLGHVIPAPKHWLQTWRWRDLGEERGGRKGN